MMLMMIKIMMMMMLLMMMMMMLILMLTMTMMMLMLTMIGMKAAGGEAAYGATWRPTTCPIFNILILITDILILSS